MAICTDSHGGIVENIIKVALPFTSPTWFEETSMIFSLCKIQAAESPKNLINT